MKRGIKSIFNATIKDVKYKIKDNKIVCNIWFYNPFSQGLQKATGVALCNPKDKFNETLGKRIAESRAKTMLYEKVMKASDDAYVILYDKYSKLLDNEDKHLYKLLHNEDDDDVILQ